MSVTLTEKTRCRFQQVGLEGDRYRLQCKRCGRTLVSPNPTDRTYAICQRRSRWGVLGEVVRWWRAGRRRRKAADVEKILAVCRVCDRYDGRRCAVCGCVMAVKARMAGTTCPLGKW